MGRPPQVEPPEGRKERGSSCQLKVVIPPLSRSRPTSGDLSVAPLCPPQVPPICLFLSEIVSFNPPPWTHFLRVFAHNEPFYTFALFFPSFFSWIIFPIRSPHFFSHTSFSLKFLERSMFIFFFCRPFFHYLRFESPGFFRIFSSPLLWFVPVLLLCPPLARPGP